MTNPKQVAERVMKDPIVRRSLAHESHYWFFNIYFAHYVKYPTASFQKEIFSITEDGKIPLAVIVAFRGSGKSTIISTSLPIWAILGKLQKKFIVILAQTQQKAKQMMMNLKQELEHNLLLKSDLGPFEESNEEWGSYSIVIPQYNARITVASSDQSIRGIRHYEHRPDLIIADDIEDLNSMKNRDSRDKLYNWLLGDVFPAGDQDTNIVIIGNLLHEDSVIMRLRRGIESRKMNGIFKEYPLVNNENKVLWSGKFTDQKSIESLKLKTGNEVTFQREYMLNFISDASRVVLPEWIHYFKSLPSDTDDKRPFRQVVTAIDPAISLKDSADKTAMVSVKVYGYDENFRIYVLPNPINKRLNISDIRTQAKALSEQLGGENLSKLLIEDVAAQAWLVDDLGREGYPAKGVSPQGMDKRSRLAEISVAIKEGVIVFPEEGAEELINQILFFGSERYDDLVDAFVMAANYALGITRARINWDRLMTKNCRPIMAGIRDMTF
ncbi:MAG: hypothetical protein ACPGO5_02740 [Patescibacteria group bacterium]